MQRPARSTNATLLCLCRSKEVIERIIFPFILNAFHRWTDTRLSGPLLDNFLERARMITGLKMPTFTAKLPENQMDQLHIKIHIFIDRLRFAMESSIFDSLKRKVDMNLFPIITIREIEEITMDLIKKILAQIDEEREHAEELKRYSRQRNFVFAHFLKFTTDSNDEYEKELGELFAKCGLN